MISTTPYFVTHFFPGFNCRNFSLRDKVGLFDVLFLLLDGFADVVDLSSSSSSPHSPLSSTPSL